MTGGGGARCWGYNANGQLGNGNTSDQTRPVAVSGLASGVQAIAPGLIDTCALTTSGGVKCWGSNQYGQLGDGTTTDHLTPVDVPSLATGVLELTAGDDFSCALTSVGGVKCWGDNQVGELGDGTRTNRPTPVDVSGLSSGVSDIDAGGDFACALLTTGGLKCWGYDLYGQLGDGQSCGNTTYCLTPVDVYGLGTGVVAVSAGHFSACALTSSNGVLCWGDNVDGELGDGKACGTLCSHPVVAMTSGAYAVTAGSDHACALTPAGGAKCWGTNVGGELGDGTTNNRYVPGDVSDLSAATTISAGNAHTCATTSPGGVKCWGINNFGQIGDGTKSPSFVPEGVNGFGPAPLPRCVVPRVVGKTLARARASIKRAHCRTGKVTRKRASSKKKKGKVIAQSPKPGKRLANGAKVRLTVGG